MRLFESQSFPPYYLIARRPVRATRPNPYFFRMFRGFVTLQAPLRDSFVKVVLPSVTPSRI